LQLQPQYQHSALALDRTVYLQTKWKNVTPFTKRLNRRLVFTVKTVDVLRLSCKLYWCKNQLCLFFPGAVMVSLLQQKQLAELKVQLNKTSMYEGYQIEQIISWVNKSLHSQKLQTEFAVTLILTKAWMLFVGFGVGYYVPFGYP